MKTLETLKRYASLGTVSHGTLRTEDLLEAFTAEIDWQIRRDSAFWAKPENKEAVVSLRRTQDEATTCWKDGELNPEQEDLAQELVNETLPDLLTQHFAAPYCYFGTHPGDGSDFGFWPEDMESIKEQVGFASSVNHEYPDDNFRGEWLHINERGNCTLYVREATLNGPKDREIWSVV